MRRTPSCLFAVLICTLLLGAACGSDSGPAETGEGDTAATTTAGERIDTDVGEALLWGDGDSGVVLAHGAAFDAESWTDQATQIAAEGTTVVAVEDISPEGIEAAVTYLKDERGIAGVALIGASAGADGILDLVSQQPDLPDQLIVLSPNSVVDGLGVSPKLFIA
ncbi:MAG TPA: alpha/beta hydrolase, partial [Candidatus Microthrix parvicella]|nr:alpha/beta hydrolase [Candidatus Microthrix parvicella]